jgi:hypothetical protein
MMLVLVGSETLTGGVSAKEEGTTTEFFLTRALVYYRMVAMSPRTFVR